LFLNPTYEKDRTRAFCRVRIKIPIYKNENYNFIRQGCVSGKKYFRCDGVAAAKITKDFLVKIFISANGSTTDASVGLR
jgi:hypothetical protein